VDIWPHGAWSSGRRMPCEAITPSAQSIPPGIFGPHNAQIWDSEGLRDSCRHPGRRLWFVWIRSSATPSGRPRRCRANAPHDRRRARGRAIVLHDPRPTRQWAPHLIERLPLSRACLLGLIASAQIRSICTRYRITPHRLEVSIRRMCAVCLCIGALGVTVRFCRGWCACPVSSKPRHVP
jgi:hypothetical protein